MTDRRKGLDAIIIEKNRQGFMKMQDLADELEIMVWENIGNNVSSCNHENTGSAKLLLVL